MNVEEFLKPRDVAAPAAEEKEESVAATEETFEEEVTVEEEGEVQKIVVEALAAEKAEQDEKIESLEERNEKLAEENKSLAAKVEELNLKVSKMKSEMEEMSEALKKTGDILSANSETELSSKIALLDREVELSDRFPGETRDQVLEVIKEARDTAEAQGRIRKAQILEAVLVANEPTGNLQKKRVALEKFFNENQNVLSGTVIAELDRCGISYKHGEEYLLPAEIIKRTY